MVDYMAGYFLNRAAATPTHGDHARMDTRSTADRLKMMKENMEMMYGQRLTRIESMQALYAALDTSQQAIFDKALKHNKSELINPDNS